MFHSLPQRSHSCQNFNLSSQNLKNYFESQLLTGDNYRNRNNNKIQNGEEFKVGKNRNECVTSNNPLNNPFNFYLKLINQLRLNRHTHLRSVSCQSESKLFSNKRNVSSQSRTQINCTQKNTDISKYHKAMIPLYALQKDEKDKPMLENIHDVFSYYSTLQNLIRNKRQILASRNTIKDNKKLMHLETLIKSKVKEVNLNPAHKDLRQIDRSYIKKNQTPRQKYSTKSIQVTGDPDSKTIDINRVDLMNYYINTLSDFISRIVGSELKHQIFNEFNNSLLTMTNENKSFGKLLNIGDCSMQVYKEFNHSEIDNQLHQPVIVLSHEITVETEASETGNCLSSVAIKSNEIIETIKHSSKSTYSKDQSQLTEEDFLFMMSDNKNSHHVLNSSITDHIKDWKTGLVSINQVTSNKKLIGNLKTHFRSNVRTCLTHSSTDISKFDSLSSIDELDDDVHKYRKNCSTTYDPEIRQISLKEFKPIIQNDISSVHFKRKKNISYPSIKIGQCQNCEISNNDSKTHLNEKKNFEENSKNIELLKVIDNRILNSTKDRNQSQNYKDSARNLLFNYINHNAGHCHRNQSFETTESSAKITLINPYCKYRRIKVFKKSNNIYEDKCMPVLNLVDFGGDFFNFPQFQHSTIEQVTYCSEQCTNKIKNNFSTNNVSKISHQNSDLIINPLQLDCLSFSIHSDLHEILSENLIEITEKLSLTCEKLVERKSKNIEKFNKMLNLFRFSKLDYSFFNVIDYNLATRSDKEHFPNRRGIQSLCRIIFQSGIFQCNL